MMRVNQRDLAKNAKKKQQLKKSKISGAKGKVSKDKRLDRDAHIMREKQKQAKKLDTKGQSTAKVSGAKGKVSKDKRLDRDAHIMREKQKQAKKLDTKGQSTAKVSGAKGKVSKDKRLDRDAHIMREKQKQALSKQKSDAKGKSTAKVSGVKAKVSTDKRLDREAHIMREKQKQAKKLDTKGQSTAKVSGAKARPSMEKRVEHDADIIHKKQKQDLSKKKSDTKGQSTRKGKTPTTASKTAAVAKGGGGSSSIAFNLNEVLRIGGVLGRYGMDKKRREAFDWLASHPNEAVNGTPEAVYNVRVSVGDLPMSKALVTQVVRLLTEKGEITQKEYERHFSVLEQNDQAITISQFAYFMNVNCEKYKRRPIVTYANPVI